MQTTYNFNPAIATEGMLYNEDEGTVILPKVAQGLVQVGILAAPGTDGQGAPSLTTADPNSTNPGQVTALPVGAMGPPITESSYIGVPIYDSSRPPYTASNQYSDQDPVPVLRKGKVWVVPRSAPGVAEAPTQFGDVYVWDNPGGGDPPAGTFATGAHGGKAVLFTHGRYLTGQLQGQFAVLEIW